MIVFVLVNKINNKKLKDYEEPKIYNKKKINTFHKHFTLLFSYLPSFPSVSNIKNKYIKT